ncbi:MAG: hypothetical protein IMZ50_03305 [Candidatus Atribacteria bacterium]|nr:hypothetical protein [Candidatus Atribacteria bacterium]
MDFSQYTGFRKNPTTGAWDKTYGTDAVLGMTVGYNPYPSSPQNYGLTSYGYKSASGPQGLAPASSGYYGGGGAGSMGIGSGNNNMAANRAESDKNAANAANLARYAAGKSELTTARDLARGLYGTAAADIAKVGASGIEDAGRGATRAFAQGNQSLISGGLYNTTMGATMARGVEEDRQRAVTRIGESQAQLRAGLAERQAGMEMSSASGLANFIAARNDTGPDTGQMAALARDAAAGQAYSQNRSQQIQGGGQDPTQSASQGRTSLQPGTPEWYDARENNPNLNIDGTPLNIAPQYYRPGDDREITNTVNGTPGWGTNWDGAEAPYYTPESADAAGVLPWEERKGAYYEEQFAPGGSWDYQYGSEAQDFFNRTGITDWTDYIYGR